MSSTVQHFADQYLRIFKFFSVWVILLTFAHNYTAKVFNLVFLAFGIVIGGAYIAFIYPRCYDFQFSSLKIKVSSVVLLCLTELVFHVMILMFVIKYYGHTYTLFSYQTLNSVALIMVYCLLNDLNAIYNVRDKDIIRIGITFVITMLVYNTLK
jgi:small-conductance mechanosensitive channel